MKKDYFLYCCASRSLINCPSDTPSQHRPVSHFWRVLYWLSLVITFCQMVAAQEEREPSREPVLRIETVMHTAAINRIGVDRMGKFLVTSSEDKTARVWELATGRLLRVLRPPISDGGEGKLHAAAISPDSNTIAASGWTGYKWDQQSSIYLFERESGKLVRRLTGLPNVVNHLAFSPDGTLLAATLGNKNGVRVWRTSDWTEVGRDTAYSDDCYGADFDHTGRLATSCRDGSVHLYDRAMHLVKKREAPIGKQLYGVRFSPDGRQLAIGYVDTPKVEVLSGDTLALLYAADTSGVSDGTLSRVAWSTDGTMLYAGGTYNNGPMMIRRWSAAGRGRYVDTPVADNTISDIVPLPSGGIAYGAADPAWGILDANLKQVHRQNGQIADYRDNAAGFLIDSTTSTVGFSYKYGGSSPSVFRLSDRTLRHNPPPDSSLRAARANEPGISITDWHNSYAPSLNGTPLKLQQFERSRSLAIAPDGERFLLGTEFNLRLFQRSGQEVWHVPSPGVAWGAQISSDNRLALAAYSDGTIRWYRLSDGKELLAFFPHADHKRWALWTPSGYYDAAPGAEDLIGWHVNNGRDAAADFFPIGQFRNVYYRPDVISIILQTGDEGLALKEANEESGRKQQQTDVARLLPPIVEIVSPVDGAQMATNEVTLRFNLRMPSGEPVTEVRVLVDGRPATAARGLALQATGLMGSERELRITVPAGESQVSVIATNRFTTSVPATVRVRTVGDLPVVVHAASALPPGVLPDRTVANDQFKIRPNLYVLSIGVSNYADPKLKLGFAAKDALDFADAWVRQKGELYRDVVVKVLTDDKATKDEVLDGLDWIRKMTTSKDVAVVLFAGHGVNDPTGIYYYLPYNANPERLLRTGVSFSDIKNTVSAIAGKTLFFIDTCHSGNVMGTRRSSIGNDINGMVNELASAENGAIVFAASTGNQYSLEKVEWHNGAFTKSVVEALMGRADYMGKGRITVNMLDLYISERVKELTGGNQTPTTAKPQTVSDFPIAFKR